MLLEEALKRALGGVGRLNTQFFNTPEGSN
jgi:hypothetical protein